MLLGDGGVGGLVCVGYDRAAEESVAAGWRQLVGQTVDHCLTSIRGHRASWSNEGPEPDRMADLLILDGARGVGKEGGGWREGNYVGGITGR